MQKVRGPHPFNCREMEHCIDLCRQTHLSASPMPLN